MDGRHLVVPLVLAGLACVVSAQNVSAQNVSAQNCPVTTDLVTYPTQPLTYPMTSDRYAVQYQLGIAGPFTKEVPCPDSGGGDFQGEPSGKK